MSNERDHCLDEEDQVNAPTHYRRGPAEVIDVMEGAVRDPASALHANVIKYTLRMNYKDDALKDARKAKWYLDRLIDILSREASDAFAQELTDAENRG